MKRSADVGIVGAGPLGIELALALKQSGVSYFLFDKGQVAQMIYNFPVGTHFFSSNERISIAGIPIQTLDQQKCTREAYLAYMRTIVMQHQLQVNTYEEVLEVESIGSEGFQLKTQTNVDIYSYQVRFLVLATGGTSKPRFLNVPGEDLRHVVHSMEDPHKYFQKKVLIIGGKNSAVESALRCYHAGVMVSLALRHRQFDPAHVKYWLLPELLGRIERGEIHCHFNCEVVEISKSCAVLRNKENGKLVEAAVDFVIKAIGFQADMSLFHQLDIKLSLEDEKPAFDENTMETSVKGIFVLGTVVGGTQEKYKVFIENTHEHVFKIAGTLCERLHAAPSMQTFLQPKQNSSDHLEE